MGPCWPQSRDRMRLDKLIGESEHGEEGEVGAGLGWLAGSWAGQLHPPGGPRAALTGMQDPPPPSHMVHSSVLSYFVSLS